MTYEQSLDATCVDSLLKAIAKRFGATVEDLRGHSRHRHLVNARQIAYWALRQRGFSYPDIGRIVNRDHTTVMQGVRKVTRAIDESVELNVELHWLAGVTAA